jgi:beta-glucosidase
VLKGTVNPAGRLPVTFYRSTDQLPPFGDYAMDGRTYRYFSGAPEYPFGHGLSYTSFTYSNLRVSRQSIAAGEKQNVSVTIRNSGERAGDEVAQLYLSVAGREGAPIRSLKGFERIHLASGAERTLSFELGPRELALADADGVMRVKPADYQLWVGGGQPGTKAPGVDGRFKVTGSVDLPR